jgi:hypothetical protein
MTNVGRNMYCTYTCGVEDILTFKTSKGPQKEVACETANRWCAAGGYDTASSRMDVP